MATLAPTHDSPIPLADWLAGREPLPIATAVQIVEMLAVQLSALHDQGRWHGRVNLAAVGIQGQTPVLTRGEPSAATIELDGELLPPELRELGRTELPTDLAAASQALSQASEAYDARRIDVYQLGVLAVRIVAGAGVENYLYRPAVSGRVPAGLRRVLDRALGFSPRERLPDCRAFLDELHQWQAVSPARQPETPSRGVSVNGSDTDIDRTESRTPRPAATRDLPFSQLGPYRIVARLGSGGMGDVYQGYDEALSRYVAIKVLPAELARSEDYVARFRNEASAAAKVEHPHIVPIYTIGVDQGRHFFAMQFVEGETLSQHLAARQPAVSWTLRIVSQVLEGLGAAHRHGLVHRDIKPGNILLADRGRRALLADFGLVKTAAQGTRMTATGVIMGTVDYISPEQGRGKPVDQRSDLYSIGVLLYQMLSGRLPFQADTPTAMIFQHAYEVPPPLAEVATQVPGDLARIVHCLLAKSPDDRYQTCDELLEDLEAVAQSRTPPHLAAAGAPRQTAIVTAPNFAEESAARAESAAAASEQSWQQQWERWYGRALLWLGRRAPELVKQLQNTQQQVDVAVLDYEDRCASLERLLQEAEEVQRLLSAQVVEHREAARAAQRQSEQATADDAVREAIATQQQNEQAAAELSRQLAAQREELEQMQLALAKASAKLIRLKGQRDALNARLKLAQARYGLHDARPSSRRRTRLAIAAGLSLGAMVLVAMCWQVWIRPRFAATSSTIAEKEPPELGPTSPGNLRSETITLAVDAVTQSVTFPVQVRSMTWVEIPPTPGFYYLLIGGTDGTVWEAYVRRGSLYEKMRRLAAHSGAVHDLAYSRQSQRIASAGDDGQVLIWDERLTQISRRLPHPASVMSISFSPLGDQLATGTRQSIQCWDVTTGMELERYSEARIGRPGLAWFPDQFAFLPAVDGNNSAVPSSAASPVHGLALTGSFTWLREMASFRGNRTTAAFSDNTVSVWDRRDQGPVRRFGEDVWCAAFTEFGLHTLTGHRDGKIILWNTFTGEMIREIVKLPARVEAVSMTPRGDFGAAVCGNKVVTLRVFEMPPEQIPGLKKSFHTPAPIHNLCLAPYVPSVASLDQYEVRTWHLEANRDPVESVAGVIPGAVGVFAPDGDHLLVARSQPDRDGFGTMTLAKLRKGQSRGIAQLLRYRGHKGGTNAATFVANGDRIVSGGNDNLIRIWDKASEQEETQFDVGTPVRALAVAGDRPGQTARVVIVGDATNADVWDLQTRQRLGSLQGHSLPPRAVAVAHKAERAVTIAGDRTARVWDLATFAPLATFNLESMPTAVAITPDGAQIVTGSLDGVLQVWNVADASAGPIVGWHNGSVTALAMSVHDRSIVSAGEDQVLCWWEFPKVRGK